MKYSKLLLTPIAFLMLVSACQSRKIEITGELKSWHKITFLFEGPHCSETGTPNPFTDFRLEAIFSKDGKTYRVLGHFAADGNTAWSSATEGSKWRVYFCPDSPGEWSYTVKFTKGPAIAISETDGESAGYMDGVSGTFIITETDKSAPDLRAKGKLQYVGEHYLQFAETGEYFQKCGADAPENLLAYEDFDATPNAGNRLKSWQAHEQDYNADAAPFLWGEQKNRGKNLLGAVNYLSGNISVY